jgi:hypothetical protein
MKRAIGVLLACCALVLPVFDAQAIAGRPTLTNSFQLFLPLVRTPDPYFDWVSLGKPAGSTPVNFLYVSQDCTAGRPATILAGTDSGLYSHDTAWKLNSGLAAEIAVSHIFKTAQNELYVSSYNLGLWRSVDGGATWDADPTPNNDARVYWLAQTDQYLYVAARLGLYRRSSAGGAWTQIQSWEIYTVAAAGGNVYAAQIGPNKDTLFISTDGGDTWPIARELPGAVNFVQTLDAQGSSQILIGTVDGGLFTLDSANNIIPFSQGVSQTVYGIWRDGLGRVYAALDATGGLRRFPQAGGASDLDLSTLPNGSSLAEETLFTVNGSSSCNIIGVGTDIGNVWLRRVP